MGHLTTHVLDTARGRPAEGVAVELWRLNPGADQRLIGVQTNADGRVGHSLLADDDFTPGVYELRFHVGDYFRSTGTPVPEPAFLDIIPIRFGIAEPGEHYHVPLLLSPYGYSTYRGS